MPEREDFLFNIDYFGNINKILSYDDYIYHYIQYEDSLSKRKTQGKFIDNFVDLLISKLENNYLNQSIVINDVILKLVADYIVKNIFSVSNSYKDVKIMFGEVLKYRKYICHSNPHNIYLKIVQICFCIKRIYPLYCYYKLSKMKK